MNIYERQLVQGRISTRSISVTGPATVAFTAGLPANDLKDAKLLIGLTIFSIDPHGQENAVKRLKWTGNAAGTPPTISCPVNNGGQPVELFLTFDVSRKLYSDWNATITQGAPHDHDHDHS
jgi:hypothetical protein